MSDFGVTMAMHTVPAMKMISVRIMAMKMDSGNSFCGFFSCLIWAAFISMPAKLKNTPAARARLVRLKPSAKGLNASGVGVTLDTLPWASHTTVKMTMNASGMNVPMMTPYLVRRAKAFTPLVDRKVRPQ